MPLPSRHSPPQPHTWIYPCHRPLFQFLSLSCSPPHPRTQPAEYTFPALESGGSEPQDMKREDWLSTVRAWLCPHGREFLQEDPRVSHCHVYPLPWYLSDIWATYAKLYFPPHLLNHGSVLYLASRPPLSLICKSHLCGQKNDPKTMHMRVA